jgi:hypothetical protein
MTENGTRWPDTPWQAALKLDGRQGFRDALAGGGSLSGNPEAARIFGVLPLAVLRDA